MADLFIKQSKEYSKGRPTYPQELFDFISSKTPSLNLAWDAGTGTGQAAQMLAKTYKNVIATDTSPKQIEFSVKLPNITYRRTPPIISPSDLSRTVGPESSVNLVTVAQAMHWFDLGAFYALVRRVLKKPDGVIAAWCYTTPEVGIPAVDALFEKFYKVYAGPYWEAPRALVDERYETIDFPFEPIDGLEHSGPFRFENGRVMGLDDYVTYLRSWSAYQTAKGKGVELLTDEFVGDLTRAWSGGEEPKVVNFPIYLRIGKICAGNYSTKIS